MGQFGGYKEIEWGSFPKSLILGILGAVLADISVKRAPSRGWAGNRRLTPNPGHSSVLCLYPQLCPRARQSRSLINVCCLTGKALVQDYMQQGNQPSMVPVGNKVAFFFSTCLWNEISLQENPSSVHVGLSPERKICVCGRHPQHFPERSENFQGRGMLLLLHLAKQIKPSKIQCGPQQEPSQALNAKVVVSSNQKVAGITLAVSAGQVFIHTFKAVSFSFPALHPLFSFYLSLVCPRQVLKVTVTVERLTLPDYSKEKGTLKNQRVA